MYEHRLKEICSSHQRCSPFLVEHDDQEGILNKHKHNQHGQSSKGKGGRNNIFDQWHWHNRKTNNRGGGDLNQHDEFQI